MVYTIAKSRVEVKIEKRINTGWENAAGGVTPRIISRIMPPAYGCGGSQDIDSENIHFFLNGGHSSEEEAKATVPMISRTKINVSIINSL